MYIGMHYNVYTGALQCILPISIVYHVPIHWVTPSYTLGCTPIYIVLHFVSHNVYRSMLPNVYTCYTMYIPIYIGYTHCVTFAYTLCCKPYTLCCISCHTMYIKYMLPNVYTCYTMYIPMYIVYIHCIHCVASHIHCVTFFVTQCIYKNMLHNVYASKCTTMYIHNVYKMQHNVYTPPYIDHPPKRGYIHCVAFYIHCVAFRYTLQVSIW